MDLIDSNDDNIENDLNNLLEEDRVVEEVEDNNGGDTEDLVIYTRNFTRYCVRGDNFKYIGCVKKVG
jgi:hypothetical protein